MKGRNLRALRRYLWIRIFKREEASKWCYNILSYSSSKGTISIRNSNHKSSPLFAFELNIKLQRYNISRKANFAPISSLFFVMWSLLLSINRFPLKVSHLLESSWRYLRESKQREVVIKPPQWSLSRIPFGRYLLLNLNKKFFFVDDAFHMLLLRV